MARGHSDQHLDDVPSATAICSSPVGQHVALDYWGRDTTALEQAREEESRQEALQRERMWYVACTRARDLRIIPELPAASSQSWSKTLDLGHHALPKLSLNHLPEPAPIRPAVVVNEQTLERFAREAECVTAAAPVLTWLRPSDHDRDRAEALEPVTRAVDDAFEYVLPVGAGRLRGVLLHKLMEELLTGELADTDAAAASDGLRICWRSCWVERKRSRTRDLIRARWRARRSRHSPLRTSQRCVRIFSRRSPYGQVHPTASAWPDEPMPWRSKMVTSSPFLIGRAILRQVRTSAQAMSAS